MQLPQLPIHTACTLCPLHQTAKHVGIPGRWIPNTLPPSPGTPAVVFLGRNPDKTDNDWGEAFFGTRGKLLINGYIKGSGLDRLASCYVLLPVRCFTPNDATPNWKRNVKPCFPYTLSDLQEIFSCHTQSTCPDRDLNENKNCEVSTKWPSSQEQPVGLISGYGALRAAIVCLGGVASQAFVGLALAESRPDNQTESFRNNGREVEWCGFSLFLVHTYHPNYYLRTPSCATAIEDHMQMLVDWINGKIVVPSEPKLVRPRMPNIPTFPN